MELQIQNKTRFQAENMNIIWGIAPEALEELDTPTHAFIGGSGGQLFAILKKLYGKNNRMRIVISAISLETLAENPVVVCCFNFTPQEECGI